MRYVATPVQEPPKLRFSTFKWLQRVLTDVDPLQMRDISDYGYEASCLAEAYDDGEQITQEILEQYFGPRNNLIEAIIEQIYPYRQSVL